MMKRVGKAATNLPTGGGIKEMDKVASNNKMLFFRRDFVSASRMGAQSLASLVK